MADSLSLALGALGEMSPFASVKEGLIHRRKLIARTQYLVIAMAVTRSLRYS
jgi:hypothetical protein